MRARGYSVGKAVWVSMGRQQRACKNLEAVAPELEEIGAPGRFGTDLRDSGAMPQSRGQKQIERATWQHIHADCALSLFAAIVHSS